MASCELDYRLSSKLQSSEEMEEEGESSDDEVTNWTWTMFLLKIMSLLKAL